MKTITAPLFKRSTILGQEGTEGGDKVNFLATLVEKYEDVRWPLSPPQLPQ